MGSSRKTPFASDTRGAGDLRRRAEQRLPERRDGQVPDPSSPDTLRLVHQLQVHQIELEMQNEELARAQLELESGLARYRSLYDFAPVGYLTLDAEGSILQANLTGARLLGLGACSALDRTLPEPLVAGTDASSQPVENTNDRLLERSQLPGRHLAELIAPASRPALGAFLARLFQGHAFETCEVQTCHETAAPLTIELAGTFAADTAECRVVATDISERKLAESSRRLLEEQLTQSQKMEAIGRLAGQVSLDFNNLLAIILGNAAMALEEAPGALVARHLRAIEEATRRAKEITSELQGYTRRPALEPHPVDLNAVVRSFAVGLQRLLGDDVCLDLLLAPDLWPVQADPSQLQQALMNLAVNARDAMPRGGRLVLETRNATQCSGRGERATLVPPGDHVVLTVSDTGAGMDAATLQHVFEPFFTTKPGGKGAGLGLSTVYAIVQQHGGSIEVRSALGRGTTFEVVLPRAGEAPEVTGEHR